jgi:hypothetical protein
MEPYSLPLDILKDMHLAGEVGKKCVKIPVRPGLESNQLSAVI